MQQQFTREAFVNIVVRILFLFPAGAVAMSLYDSLAPDKWDRPGYFTWVGAAFAVGWVRSVFVR